jgi:Zn-dependent protease
MLAVECGRCGRPAELTIPILDARSYTCIDVPACRECYENYSPRIRRGRVEWRRTGAVMLSPPPFILLGSRRAAALLCRVLDRLLSSRIVRALVSSAPYFLLSASALAAGTIIYTTLWYASDAAGVERVRAFYRSNPLVGVGIAGLDPSFPILEALLALALAAAIHEASHAAVLRMHGYDVRRVGLILLGPLPVGAFIEPPGNVEYRMSRRQLLQLAGAGITANILAGLASLGAVFLILMGVVPQSPEALAAAARLLEDPGILLVPPALLSMLGVATPMSAPKGWYTHVVLGPHYALPLSIAQHIFIINVFLGIINALPARPFDGGLILQALLGERLGLKKTYMLSTTLAAAFMASILIVVAVARI